MPVGEHHLAVSRRRHFGVDVTVGDAIGVRHDCRGVRTGRVGVRDVLIVNDDGDRFALLVSASLGVRAVGLCVRSSRFPVE